MRSLTPSTVSSSRQSNISTLFVIVDSLRHSKLLNMVGLVITLSTRNASSACSVNWQNSMELFAVDGRSSAYLRARTAVHSLSMRWHYYIGSQDTMLCVYPQPLFDVVQVFLLPREFKVVLHAIHAESISRDFMMTLHIDYELLKCLHILTTEKLV